MRRFIVTGCGRSGTGFTAAALRAAGVNCGHEQVYTIGVARRHSPVEWAGFDADASWLATPPYQVQASIPVVQVVRHPLDVVKSCLDIGLFTDRYANPYTAVIDRFDSHVFHEDTEHDRALRWWLDWNQAAQVSALMRFRIEDLNDWHLADFVAATGNDDIELHPVNWHLLKGSDTLRNTKWDEKTKHVQRPTWDAFRPALAETAARLAAVYGYGI